MFKKNIRQKNSAVYIKIPRRTVENDSVMKAVPTIWRPTGSNA